MPGTDCLIVEDNQDNSFICSHILQSLGFHSSSVENAEDAMPICEAGAPTLIILDWNLPGKSGMEFLRDARSKNLLKNAKVVMCTAQNDVESVQEAMSEGVDGYITKPFERETFAKQLRAIGLLAD